MRNNGIPILIVAILVVGTAFALLSQANKAPSAKTFYVVAYSWGYAFFDENSQRIDKIAVSRGDRVILHVMSVKVLTEEGINAFVDEQVRKGLGRIQPNDPQIRDLVKRAMEHGLWDHTLTIGGYGLTVEVDGTKSQGKARSVAEAVASKDPTVRTLEFVAEKRGRFAIYCAVYECGFGHTEMIVPAGLIVS